MRKGIFLFLACMLSSLVMTSLLLGQEAVQFEDYFEDSSLRMDYIFSGSKEHVALVPENFHQLDHWYGRRHHLDSLHLEGTGKVLIHDEATKRLIYCSSFSTLFQEWLATEEATRRSVAYENVFLAPYPKNPVLITLELFDVKRNKIATSTTRLDPKDILIRKEGSRKSNNFKCLHRGGDSRKAIDVAILAEGFTKDELPVFERYAQTAVNEILKHEPFKAHAQDFNFYMVESISQDSGVSVPRRKDWKRTAFSSHFDTFYSDRYLTSRSLKAIHDALLGVPYEHIIIIANDPVYGGGGVYNSFTLTSTHRWFEPVVVHEFGHSFGGLADEYFYDEDVMTNTYDLEKEPWEQNITTLVNFKGNKWSKLIPSSAKDILVRGQLSATVRYQKKYPIGLFEGGAYSKKGIYRCSYDCRMRTNEYPKFCPACQLALDRLITYYCKP